MIPLESVVLRAADALESCTRCAREINSSSFLKRIRKHPVKVRTRYSAAGLLCLLLPFLSGTGSSGSNFPPAESLPPRSGLPDPLVMRDGKPLGSKAEWFNERRPELKTLFQHYMYGPLSPKPARM